MQDPRQPTSSSQILGHPSRMLSTSCQFPWRSLRSCWAVPSLLNPCIKSFAQLCILHQLLPLAFKSFRPTPYLQSAVQSRWGSATPSLAMQTPIHEPLLHCEELNRPNHHHIKMYYNKPDNIDCRPEDTMQCFPASWYNNLLHPYMYWPAPRATTSLKLGVYREWKHAY